MRVTPTFTNSELDRNGVPLLTSFNTLDMHAPGRTLNFFASRSSRYSGFNELGVDANTGTTATWANRGPYPSNLVAILTDTDLTLSFPVDAPQQLEVWIRYERSIPPSAVLEDVVESTKVVWGLDVTEVHGLFGGPLDGVDRVRVGSGAVWILTRQVLSVLDFTQDRAVAYLNDYGFMEDPSKGLDPDTIPGSIDNIFDDTPIPSLAVPCAPYRSITPYARKSFAVVSVTGGSSVCLLSRDFSVPGGNYEVSETVNFATEFGGLYKPTDSIFLPDGRIVVVGFVGESSGPLFWSVRSNPVSSVISGGASNWSVPKVPSSGFVGSSPRVRINDAGSVWASFDRGIIKWRDLAANLSESTRVEFWSGMRGDDLGVDPRHKAIDPAEKIRDFSFSKDVPGILLDAGEARGGGSLLNVMDPLMRQVVYRRRYQSTSYTLNPSPLKNPRSRIVVAGQTKSPPPGIGPDL